MKTRLTTWTILALIATACLAGCEPGISPAPDQQAEAVPSSADDTEALGVGDTIPDVTLRTLHGEPLDLRQAVADQPTVLVFYRGGWCPYCNAQLSALGQVEGELTAMGYQIIAISPDQPSAMAVTVDEHELTYTVLSDSDMTAARAFGLAFRVDDELVTTYKSQYGIDLERASGETHHQLPVPAVYILDQSATIRFAYVNPNYKVRIDPETLVDQAREALAE